MDNRILDYRTPQELKRPRTRWGLLVLLLLLVPFLALGFSIILIMLGYIGPGD